MIVIVFGLPGSGKSFFASRLAELLNAAYINSDRVRLEMLNQRSYSGQEKSLVYQEMLREMEMKTNNDRHVVLDATFFQHEMRERFRIAGHDAGVPVYFIEIQADVDLIRQRLSRKREYSEADFEVYLLIREMFEDMSSSHLVLSSTDSNIDEMLTGAVSYLEEQERIA